MSSKSEIDETNTHNENELLTKVEVLKLENKLIREKYETEIKEIHFQKQAEIEKNVNLTDLVLTLEQQNAKAQSQVSQLWFDVAQGECEVSALKKTASAQESLVNELKTLNSKVEMENQMLSVKNSTLLENNLKQQDDIEKLSCQLSDSECECKDLVETVQRMKNQYTEDSLAHAALIQRHLSLKQTVEELKNEIEACQSESEQIREAASYWRDKFETSETSVEKVRVQLSAAEEAAHKSGCRNKELEETVKNLQEQMRKLNEDSELELIDLIEENVDLYDEVDKLQLVLGEKQAEIEHMTNENCEMSKKLERMEVSNLVVDRLKEENKLIREKYETEITEIIFQKQAETEKNENLTDLVARLEQQNATVQSQVSQLRLQVAQLQDTLKNNQSERDDTVQKLNSTMQELEKFKGLSEYWKQMVNVNQQEQQLLRDDCAQFQARQSDLEAQIEDLSKTLKQLTAELEIKQTKFDKSEDDMKSLKKTTSALESLVNELKTLSSKVEMENQMLSVKNSTLLENCLKQQDDIEKLSCQLSDSESERSVLAQKVVGDTQDQKILKEQIEFHSGHVVELKAVNSKLESLITEQRKEFNNTILEKDVLLDEQHSKVVDLEQTIKEQCGQLEDHRQNIKGIRHQLEQRLEMLLFQAPHGVSSQSFFTEEDILFPNPTVPQNIKEKDQDLIEQTELVSTSLLEIIEQYQKQSEDKTKPLLAKVVAMQAEIDEFVSKEQKIKNEQHLLKSELKGFQEKLDEAHQNIIKNEDLIKNQNTDIYNLRRINTSLTAEVVELKGMNEELKCQAISLVEKNDKLTSEMVHLERQIEEEQLTLLGKEELIEKQQTKITDLETLAEELYANLNDRRQTIQELRQQLDHVSEEEIFQNLASEIPTSATEDGDIISNEDLEPTTLAEGEELDTVSECQASILVTASPTQSELPGSDPDNERVNGQPPGTLYSVARGVMYCGALSLSSYVGYMFGRQVWGCSDPNYEGNTLPYF